MKFRHLLLSSLTLLATTGVTHAAVVDLPNLAEPGLSYHISVVEDGVRAVTGTIDGEELFFYTDRVEVTEDAPLSRGEFIRLLFLNHDGELPNPYFPITDLDETSPLYITAQRSLQAGVTSVDGDFRFDPNKEITRAEAAMLLMRYMGLEFQREAQSYSDVPTSSPYYSLIHNVSKLGVMDGFSDGTFRPEGSLSYGDGFAMLRKILNSDLSFRSFAREGHVAYMPISRRHNDTTLDLELTLTHEDGSTSQESRTVRVAGKWWPSQSFTLPAHIFKLYDPEIRDASWKMVTDSMGHKTSFQLWEGGFLEPAKERITASFGRRRWVNGQYVGSHFGVDWATPTGTPIIAANRGVIRLSTYVPSYGNTVLIDHGRNVYGLYLHLSELGVDVGEVVEKGQEIGKAGSTGISTGSHLHYTHLIGEVAVEPFQWITE